MNQPSPVILFEYRGYRTSPWCDGQMDNSYFGDEAHYGWIDPVLVPMRYEGFPIEEARTAFEKAVDAYIDAKEDAEDLRTEREGRGEFRGSEAPAKVDADTVYAETLDRLESATNRLPKCSAAESDSVLNEIRFLLSVIVVLSSTPEVIKNKIEASQ